MISSFDALSVRRRSARASRQVGAGGCALLRRCRPCAATAPAGTRIRGDFFALRVLVAAAYFFFRRTTFAADLARPFFGCEATLRFAAVDLVLTFCVAVLAVRLTDADLAFGLVVACSTVEGLALPFVATDRPLPFLVPDLADTDFAIGLAALLPDGLPAFPPALPA